MKIAADSWHYRYLRDWGEIRPNRMPKDLCSYVRAVVLGLLRDFTVTSVSLWFFGVGLLLLVSPWITYVWSIPVEDQTWGHWAISFHGWFFGYWRQVLLGIPIEYSPGIDMWAAMIPSGLLYAFIFAMLWASWEMSDARQAAKEKRRLKKRRRQLEKITQADIDALEREMNPPEPSIFMEYLKARYRKICPLLEYEDEGGY